MGGNTARKRSCDGLRAKINDDAAKSVVERVATFLTILFGVTAFGSTFPPPYLKDNIAAKPFVIVTLVLYLVALGAGMWAIQPRYYRCYTYNISLLAKELEKITKRKMFWLRSSLPSSGMHSSVVCSASTSIPSLDRVEERFFMHENTCKKPFQPLSNRQ
jgi:hypothetical protein